MGIIVAIGGYAHENKKEHDFDTPIEIDKEILRLSGKKKPNVLFVPTASSDSLDYIAAVAKIYSCTLACFFEVLRLFPEKPSTGHIQSLIDWADVIYVGGGNTLMMMKTWRKLGLDKMLKQAYKQGKVLCGVSAGSICWFEYGVSDSLHFYDKKETKYIKVRGLGILPGVHCPHFKSKTYDNKHRSRRMKEVMQRCKGKCLAIPDGSAVVFENKKKRCIGIAKSSLCWWEDGKWCEYLL